MNDMAENDSAVCMEKKGIGIDELRYRRAYALARCEMARLSLQEELASVRKGFGGGFLGKGIAGRIIGSLNYFDWAFLAFRIAGKIAKWRKRK